MNSTDRLDIILFGASGFTGKRIIPKLTELIKSQNLTLTWGVAGRSESTLKNTLLEMQQKTGEDYSEIPIIHADIKDVQSIEKMTAATKVIINYVGPYSLYGEIVIEACLKTGTHQVDICAGSYVEPQYIEEIQTKYHQLAKEKGIYIVSGCAIDSMAADLGAILLQKYVGGNIDSIESHLCFSEGDSTSGPIVNYGTYDSYLHGYGGNAKFGDYLKLFSPSCIKDIYVKRRALNAWYILFPAFEKSLLNKTQKHMNEIYGQKPVIVRDHIGFSKFGEFISLISMAPLILLMSKCRCAKNILQKYPRFFTCGQSNRGGPNQEKQEKTTFRVVLIGKCTGKSKPQQDPIIADVSGKDPYGLTCIFAAISAIMILTEGHQMPDNGGYYSPGAAFTNTSVMEKLEKLGFKFIINPKIDL